MTPLITIDSFILWVGNR